LVELGQALPADKKFDLMRYLYTTSKDMVNANEVEKIASDVNLKEGGNSALLIALGRQLNMSVV